MPNSDFKPISIISIIDHDILSHHSDESNESTPVSLEEARSIFEETVPAGKCQEELLALKGINVDPNHESFCFLHELQRLDHTFQYTINEGSRDTNDDLYQEDVYSIRAFDRLTSALTGMEKYQRDGRASAVVSWRDTRYGHLYSNQNGNPSGLYRCYIRSRRGHEEQSTAPDHIETSSTANEESGNPQLDSRQSSPELEEPEPSVEDSFAVVLPLPAGIVLWEMWSIRMASLEPGHASSLMTGSRNRGDLRGRGKRVALELGYIEARV